MCSCVKVLDVLCWGLKSSYAAWTFINGGLGISILQFLMKKKIFHLSILGHQNPGSGSVSIQPKMLNPDPDQMNTDPKDNQSQLTSPVVVSTVTTWPSASCRTLMGTPIVAMLLLRVNSVTQPLNLKQISYITLSIYILLYYTFNLSWEATTVTKKGCIRKFSVSNNYAFVLIKKTLYIVVTTLSRTVQCLVTTWHIFSVVASLDHFFTPLEEACTL